MQFFNLHSINCYQNGSINGSISLLYFLFFGSFKLRIASVTVNIINFLSHQDHPILTKQPSKAFCKKVILKILQILQENKYVGVSF